MRRGARRGLGRLACATAVVAGTLGVLTLPTAAADPEPAEVLQRARAAAARTTLAGTVEVQWLVDGQVRVERTGARADGAGFVVGRGDRRAVGEDGVRWSADAGVSIAWGSATDADAPLPDPDASWDLDLGPSAEVAGRPALVVRASGADGRVRARFYVDQATDVLLRRDVLDERGEIVRSVRFTRVRLAEGDPAVPRPPAPAPPPRPPDPPPSFAAPEVLEPGFHLIGRYAQPDGVIQLFYADGLFTLSVFEQPGLVDWSAIPDGGVRGEVDGERAHTFATASGTVVVWGTDDTVLTAVSDAPPDTLAAVLEEVASGRSVFSRVADFVLGPFGWD